MPSKELLDVRNALVDDDRAGVVKLVDPLVDAFDERRNREEALSAFARQMDAAASPESDAETAAVDVLTAAREAATARSRLTTVLSGYLKGQKDAMTAVDTAETAIDKSEAFESAEATARDFATNLVIPPALLISAPDSIQIPKGKSLDIEITMENLGTSAAESLEVTTESDLDVTVPQSELDSLTGGESTTIRLVGSPTTSVTSTLSVFVEGDNSFETVDIDVTVISRLGYLKRAATQFDELKSDIEIIRLKDESKGNGWLQRRRNEIQSLDKRLGQLIDRVQAGDSSDSVRRIRQLEEKILKLRDRIEKRANMSDNSNGKGNRQKQEISPADGTLMAVSITAIVDTLKKAHVAEV